MVLLVLFIFWMPENNNFLSLVTLLFCPKTLKLPKFHRLPNIQILILDVLSNQLFSNFEGTILITIRSSYWEEKWDFYLFSTKIVGLCPGSNHTSKPYSTHLKIGKNWQSTEAYCFIQKDWVKTKSQDKWPW